MSNAVFPALAGLTPKQPRRPMFKTRVQQAVSGRELRASFQQYPIYQFGLGFDVLRDGIGETELDTLCGFFLARQGSFDSFLYTDPADNTVTDMPFGTGTGIATVFQLSRAFGAGGFTFSEPVQNLNAVTAIKKNGVTLTLTTDYTIDATGLVSFVVAPPGGHTLTWSGSFYYRCRFLADVADFESFLKDLWELRKIEFIGATGNRL